MPSQQFWTCWGCIYHFRFQRQGIEQLAIDELNEHDKHINTVCLFVVFESRGKSIAYGMLRIVIILYDTVLQGTMRYYMVRHDNTLKLFIVCSSFQSYFTLPQNICAVRCQDTLQKEMSTVLELFWKRLYLEMDLMMKPVSQ